MKLQILLLIIAFVFIGSVNDVFGQADFFWSTYDLNEGAQNSDLTATFESGESASLYLYYSTNGPADSDLSVGAFLDLATSVAGVIEFTRAETFDFYIEVGTPVGKRWLNAAGTGGSVGETGIVTSDFIDEWHAFTVTGGPGILEMNNGSGAFIDVGYDGGADAFLFGVIEFDVVGNAGDSVNLITSSGNGMIVNGDEVVDAVFGGATINIAGIPEPTTAGLLAFGLTVIACRRRKMVT